MAENNQSNDRTAQTVEEIIEELCNDLSRCVELVRESFERKSRTDEAYYKIMLKQITDMLSHVRRKLPVIGKMHGKLYERFEVLRESVVKLQEEIKRLTAPPLTYGTVISVHADGTMDVLLGGRQYRLKAAKDELLKKVAPGARVLVSESEGAIVVDTGNSENTGEIGTVDAVLDDNRLRITTNIDEKRVCLISENLREEKFSVGDEIRCGSGNFVLERLQKAENKKLWMEKVEPVEYSQIGGLASQIEKIRKEIEQPFLHKNLYREYDAEISKGVLLYGPPGCGKTLIAKAIAWHLSKKLAEIKNLKTVEGYFLNVRGPELLNKFVGETERQIRQMFADARERANEFCPVIIFLDEADSLLKTRGSGISSDVEMTTTPQFLTMLDGVESNKNVIVILASNRQDLIDPAVLRPGRVDCKIRVNRPNCEEAGEIFRIYLTRKEVPLSAKYSDEKHPLWKEKYREFNKDRKKIVDYLIEGALNRLWATKEYKYKDARGNMIEVQNSILELTLASGSKRTLYLCDLVSGAVIKNIANRAKKNAIERFLVSGPEHGGIMTKDLCIAIEQEMVETEDLPNTKKDAENWLDIEGISEKIVHIESLVAARRKELSEQKSIETITTGHYL